MFLTTSQQTASPSGSKPYVEPAKIDPSDTIWTQWSPMKRWRRKLVGYVYRFPDTGLFGLTPLQTHIVICGYPRSGTTLLLAMMEYALPGARRFGEEIGAWRAATHEWRNHAVIVSKKPDDVYVIHRMRNFYTNRHAKLRVIVMVRDPRDVLTSRHAVTGPSVYFEDIAAWRQRHEYVKLYRNDPGVLMIYYEELVTNTAEVCKRVETYTGISADRSFTDFHSGLEGFNTQALNGVRPVDAKTMGRWRRPEHRERIEQILRESPDFCEVLVDMGWEKDDSWVEEWRRSFGNS